jgi:DOPA 4,5-dioxygenase
MPDEQAIGHYHAHIYYDPELTRAKAAVVRAGIEAAFPSATMGRWHDVPVGPHSCAMYQVAFSAELLPRLVPWLMLNRQGLDVLLHPETGHERADHSDHAAWFGHVLELDLLKLPE